VALTPEQKKQAADAALYALTVENDEAKARRIAAIAAAADTDPDEDTK
jgi:hypothetical protein